MSEWISVKDRSPEEYQDVLCIDEYDNVFDITIGHFWSDINEKPYWIDHHSHTLQNVTHWMPLPDSPKQ